MLVWLLALVPLVALLVLLVVHMHRESARRQRYLAAAYSIVQEDYLDYSLRMNKGEKPPGRRVMLYLRALGVAQQVEFVFDPAKTVTIGRHRTESSILLNEATVSLRHCILTCQNGAVWLQDVGADNGTWVKRGLRRYHILNGAAIQLRSGDVLKIGSNRLKLVVFQYDVALM